MFSETSCSVLFSCKMRKFETRQPCWDLSWKYQAPSTSRIGKLNWNSLSLWNDLWLVKVSRHGLHFLKPENRAMRRCRSLIFSQSTWITIFWNVIMEFFPNDAKIFLPTEALSGAMSVVKSHTITIFCCAMQAWSKQGLTTYVTEGWGGVVGYWNQCSMYWLVVMLWCSGALQHCGLSSRGSYSESPHLHEQLFMCVSSTTLEFPL